jgi:hypothetical protein
MLYQKIKSFLRIRLQKLFQRSFDDLKILSGQSVLENKRQNYQRYNNINQAELKIFSQFGEDGIIDFLIETLNIKFIKFVEVGTADYSESNTRFLFETGRAEGLIIDSDRNLVSKVKRLFQLWRGNIKIISLFVDKENLIDTLKKNDSLEKIDLFSMDVDGVDYWLIKELPDKISKIFIAEYNANFGPNLEVSVPYIKDFDRTIYHYSNLGWGMSLKALVKLMNKKGYEFVGTNSAKCNAFFIRKDLIKLIKINLPNTDDLSHHTDIKINEGLNHNKQLAFYSKKQKAEVMQEIEVIDLKSENIEKKIKLKDLI